MHATLFHCTKQTVLPCRVPKVTGWNTEPNQLHLWQKMRKRFKMILSTNYSSLDPFSTFVILYPWPWSMIHHPQGATLFLLLNHVAVLADSHVWNFKLHGNINLSRLEQAHAYTDIISQKENHFGVIFQRRTGGWQLGHVAIMGKKKTKTLYHFISQG